MRRCSSLVAICLFAFLLPTLALAAQDLTVVSDNAPIHKNPAEDSPILEYLPMGLEVRVSANPLAGGWYKVRARTGEYGWIYEKFLSVRKERPGDGEFGFGQPTEAMQRARPERDRKWFVRGFGSFDFFQPADLNNIFTFGEFNTGYNYGFEVGYFLSRLLALEIRGEVLLKDVVAKENLSSITYNMGIRSYPIMAGLDFFLVKLPSMRLSFGAFAGVAYSTSFSIQALNQPPPNAYTIQASAFTTLARVNLTRPLGRVLSVFIEGGYRLLKTDALDTSSATSINGGQVFLSYGQYKARVIDLSGFVFAGGLGIHF